MSDTTEHAVPTDVEILRAAAIDAIKELTNGIALQKPICGADNAREILAAALHATTDIPF